jgi:hypothetical protein
MLAATLVRLVAIKFYTGYFQVFTVVDRCLGCSGHPQKKTVNLAGLPGN